MTDWYAGITALCFLLSAVYLWWTAGIIAGLFMLRPGGCRKEYAVSVVIPARNEAGTLGRCLEAVLGQDYPAGSYEVVVVDDRSADGTGTVADGFVRLHPGRVRVVRIGEDDPGIPGKKRAVTRGIEAAANEIILVTDADCVAGPGWIRGMVSHFEPDVGVVAGATFFERQAETSFAVRVLATENAALVAAGAGSIGAGRPSICNGSNLAYRKSVFLQVGGFAGIDGLASGDDDMFIQKVSRTTPWRSAFSAAPGTFCRTRPPRTLGEFVNQRVRWSSKGGHYPDRLLTFYLQTMYVYYIVCCAGAVMAAIHPARSLFLIFLLLSKFAAEAAVAVRGCVLFGRRDLIPYVPVLGLLFMPYVLVISTMGMFRAFSWKGAGG